MVKNFKKKFSGFVFLILFVNLIFTNKVIAETIGKNQVTSGTAIGGIILSDTKLTLENSPYTLTKDIQIAYGVTLTIDAGVVIKGNNYNINTWGVLSAVGTNENKITFENVNIGIKGESDKLSFFNIVYANIYGGSIVKPTGNAVYGSFNLIDSYIKNTKEYMHIWYPTANIRIERNVFDNAKGIDVGTSGSIEVAIRNNVFYKQTSGYAIENWASYDTSKTIVENNSFLSNDRVALRLPEGYTSAKMIGINNYWNTEDSSIIDEMIFDKNDDLSSAGIIKTSPILLKAHEKTPKSNYENLNLIDLNLKYSKEKVMVDKPIAVKFNKNLNIGPGFDKLALKDRNGNIVPVEIRLNKNELLMVPKSYMNYYENYKIEIAKDSLKDDSGNYMESDYYYEFITETPRIDVDNNSVIDVEDMNIVASNYNMTSENEKWNSLYDFNGDKIIDIYDFIIISKAIKW